MFNQIFVSSTLTYLLRRPILNLSDMFGQLSKWTLAINKVPRKFLIHRNKFYLHSFCNFALTFIYEQVNYLNDITIINIRNKETSKNIRLKSWIRKYIRVSLSNIDKNIGFDWSLYKQLSIAIKLQFRILWSPF